MRKLTPIKLNDQESEELEKQLGVQEIVTGTPKSSDPVNYPVWSILTGKKALIYVPNHVVQGKDGVDVLRMDMPLVHSVTVGKRYFSYRCTANLSVGDAVSGNCPLCEGCAEPWDLANAVIEHKCKAQGLDPADVDNENVKTIRSAEFSKRVIKNADRHFTFPIIHIETANDDGKTLVKDENGAFKYKVYWYDISETMYNEKWVPALESIEDEPNHPGGKFFVLNYDYATKNPNQQKNARDAARKMTVSHRPMKNSEAARKKFDEITEGWTPRQARETVLANKVYSDEDLKAVADDALEQTRQMLALYDFNGVEGDENSGAIESKGGFSLSRVEEGAGEDVPDVAISMETDLDAAAGTE